MSILDHSPHFSAEEARRVALELYGLSATASPLPSERDQNFLLLTGGGERFILKIANGAEARDLLDAQNAAMAHLARRVGFCPRVAPAETGMEIERIFSDAGQPHFVRLVSYLPGVPLGATRYHSAALLRDLGRSLGLLDAALARFDHPALHRDFHWDLANGLRVVHQGEALIEDAEMRRLVGAMAADFERTTAPLLPALRRSIIHNDANDYNVLVGGGSDLYTYNQSVTGLIDFGDMVYSYTVGDLAVAAAYAILDKPDPLAAASQVVAGYHAVYPLQEMELAALFGLVTLRLCMSVCMAAAQQQRQPENAYLGISQDPIRRSAPRLAALHPRFAEAALRAACGFPPARSNPPVVAWLQGNAGRFAPIMAAPDPRRSSVLALDLSVGSPLVDSDPRDACDAARLAERIRGLLERSGATMAIGRYDEARYLNVSPAFATGSGVTDEHRTIHLGMDLFAEAGAPIYAPLAGRVHVAVDNAARQDYGPLIILEHRAGEGQPFYTLYGHLSRESLERVHVGQAIEQGERLATLGAPEVNGGWPPHLHFQIITDLLELGRDFPGSGRASQRELWLSFSPDPNLIVGIPSRHLPRPEPDKAATLAIRRERLGRNLSIAYRDPVKVARGWMQYLFDETGRKYLDAYNNVPHVGHCHPRVVEAACQQLGVLNTNTRYLHDLVNCYAERLSALLPDPLTVCFFVNSASEANELALRLVRAYTGQRDMIVLDAAYHGHTTSLIDISPYKHAGPGGAGAPDWVHVAPIPDGYRGAYKSADPRAGEKYAGHVAALIAEIRRRRRGLGGFIAESLPSVGGQIVFPPGYLDAVYRAVRAAGGVCIADEVQTGFGRIGAHFWGFEAQGVVPDIVVLGKPIGNGHPIGAVVTRPEIAHAFDNGMEFFSTFGGNTVSCAVGLAVLDVLRDEGLQAHALRVGETMLAGLRPLVERYALVGDVRGSGLFLGVELVRNRRTLEPATEEAAFVTNRMREHGILLGTDGPYHNVIKIRPPMPFDAGDAGFLVATLEKILAESFSG